MKKNHTLSFVIVIVLLAATFGTNKTRAQIANTDIVFPDWYSQNVELVGQIGGTVNNVFVNGGYAYVAIGPRLVILDVSNPAAPVQISKTDPFPDDLIDIFVSGNTAYIISNGVYILDVSNPQNPTVISRLEPGQYYPWSIYIVNNLAYIGEWGRFRVMNVSNPYQPIDIGRFLYADDWFEHRDMVVDGNYVYIAAGNFGLVILDVSNPSHPFEISRFATPYYAMSIRVNGDNAYVGDYSGGVRSIDISNPSNPHELGSMPIMYPWGIDVSGSNVYVAADDMYILDASDPANPIQVGSYQRQSGSDIRVVQVVGNIAYVTTRDDLKLLDISDPSSIREIYSFPSYIHSGGSSACGLSVKNNLAYSPGSPVVDVSDPANPRYVSESRLPKGDKIVVDGTMAYITNSTGLRIVDVSNPTNPNLLSTVSHANSVFINGNFAYITYSYYLEVIDISDPRNPVELGFDYSFGNAVDVWVVDNLAYVIDYTYGLRIVDVSDPSNFVEIGSFPIPDHPPISIAVENGRAYIGVEQGGSYIIDISIPAQPILLGESDLWYYAHNIVPAGSLIYSNMGGTYILDANDPANVQQIGHFLTMESGCGLSIESNLIYVADTSGGLYILRYSPSLSEPIINANLRRSALNLVDFPAGSNATVQIYDTPGGNLLYTYTVGIPSSGNRNISYREILFRLLPGMQIVVNCDACSNPKTLTIEALSIDSVDYPNDILRGTANPGAQVVVSVWDDQGSSSLTVQADVNGAWLADFGEIDFDITVTMNLAADVYDSDGDDTFLINNAPFYLTADSIIDSIYAGNVFPNSLISLAIYDSPDGNLVFSPSEFLTNYRGEVSITKKETGIDLQPGMEIQVTEARSGIIKSLELENLIIDQVDYEHHIVSGRSVPGAELFVDAYSTFNQAGSWEGTVGPNGTWTADLSDSGMENTGYYEYTAYFYNQNGEEINATWIPKNVISGNLTTDSLGFENYASNSLLQVSIYSAPGGSLLYGPYQLVTSPEGSFTFDRSYHGIDLTAGMLIQVEDIATHQIETLELVNLTIDTFDKGNGVLAGSVSPGGLLRVNAGNDGLFCGWYTQNGSELNCNVDPYLGSNGHWQVNFKAMGFDTSGNVPYRVTTYDVDGDQTIVMPTMPDTDGDSIPDSVDNAPTVYNPDQKQSDSDGIADVIDPCPLDPTNTCNQSGSAAVSIGTTGGVLETPNQSTEITVPPSALPGDTSISITDIGTGFVLETDVGQSTAVFGVEIGPPGTTFNTPVSLVFSWLDATSDGIVDGTTQREADLFVSKDSVAITLLCSADPGCDQVANSFTFQVNSLSVFALATLNNQPPLAEAGGPYSIAEGSIVTLDASGSSDPDGDSLTYAWDLDGNGQYDDANGITANFQATDDGQYVVGLQVTDSHGASATDTATISVSNVAPTLQNIQAPIAPLQVGAHVMAQAAFSDPGLQDTHTALWDWGDGATTTGTLNGYLVTGSHTYALPGVYRLQLTVSDDDGASVSAIFEYIVIYDPQGGFVTGGGWINSQPGAYKANPTLEGKANYGFNSKYKKGASLPTGNVEFQFKPADLNFHSETFQWLVVSQSNSSAVFKGTGSLNGQNAPVGDYHFMIWVTDGNPDTFQIRIWWVDENGYQHIIYDNGSLQPTGGGNIKVH